MTHDDKLFLIELLSLYLAWSRNPPTSKGFRQAAHKLVSGI